MKFIIGGLVLFALSILCLLISLNKIDTAKEEKKKAEKLLQKAYEIKAEKDLENETYLYNLLNQISQAKSSLSTLKKQIQEEETRYLNEREEIDRTLKFYENRFSYVSNQYVNTLEKRYEQIEKDFDQKVSKFQKQEEDLNNEIKILENQISNMRESLAANTKAALREQEKKNKLDFYKLTLTPFELEDIIKLNTIKTVLHQPVVLSKLIWSTYFQKQATEMCNRILGTSKICGIYKITYIETEQSYIGQSVNVGA